MNKFLLRFSDVDIINEKRIDNFIKSTKKKLQSKKKTIKAKKIKIINQAKGLTYSEFLKSKYWDKVRRSILKRDGYKCTVCGTEEKLIVHHITYTNHGYEHLYLEDLVTLCNDCHKITHNLI